MMLTATPITMSSAELAELTGKAHSHVLRDIRSMLDSLGDDPVLDHVVTERDARGYAACVHLPRDLTMLLLTGYSAPLRLRVIRRMDELERQQSPRIPQTMAEALRLAADQAEQLEAAQQQLEQQRPAVEFVGRYVESSGTMTLTEVAKTLNAKRPELIEWLIEIGALYRIGRNLTPYQQHKDVGRFEVVTGSSNGHAYTHPKVTAKGLEWIAGKWAVRGIHQNPDATKMMEAP
jgi:phage antirepressor YoqD-like protein